MQLARVILYQNGIGYFERTGHVGGDTVRLALARGELDDVLKTLTVIDRSGAGVATVDVPTAALDERTIALGVRLAAGRDHDVAVGYAVPTPTWRAAYRVVLDEGAQAGAQPGGLLQGWAMIHNASQDDWRAVQLTLATGAPLSFALDLHTPRFVQRPDATQKLVGATVTGPIESEVETFNGDRDGDGIPDAMDKCPDEPENFDGFEDSDGCPDRGRVVLTESLIEIRDNIAFARGSATLAPAARPILDAIAATLREHPDIAVLDVEGHASADEADPWDLAERRAAAVHGALVARGIAGKRMVMMPIGATRPIDGGASDAARAKNRRVEFRIAKREGADASGPAPAAVRGSLATSIHAGAKPADVAGAVRYVLSEPVSVKRGASAMVSILNQHVAAEDAFLFRPDGNAPGSDRHPFRVVRLANDSGFTLEPGSVAIFARGSFVGDGLLGHLDLGETAWIPYALDGGTTVTVASDAAEQPAGIVAIHRGVITVEDRVARTTRYTIAAGREPAKILYVRHGKLAGATAKDLPPGTQDRGDDYLVPLPLAAGKTSTLAIEERLPRRRTIALDGAPAAQLGLYVAGTPLPAALSDKLAAAIAAREALGALDERIDAARSRTGELAQRAEELRESLRTVEKLRGADDLRKKLVADLAQTTADADALARQLGGWNEEATTARAKLADLVRDVTLAE